MINGSGKLAMFREDAPSTNSAQTKCISVIIPAKNAASTITDTLASLAPDRAVIHEIILVDDGSADGTSDIARSVAARARLPFKVVGSNAGNAGASRNIGLEIAEGDFIFFLDSDDQIVSGGLIALFDCLLENPKAGLAVGGYIRRTSGRGDKKRLPNRYTSDRLENAENYLLNRHRSIAIGSALLRHGRLADIRFPERLRFDEDTLYWAMVLTLADVATIPRLIMIYNVVDERFTNRFTSDVRKEYLKLSIALGGLAAYGLPQNVIKWRRAWIARRIARAFINVGNPEAAEKFMRLPAVHPSLRWTAATNRYAFRIRLRRWRGSMEHSSGNQADTPS